MILDGVWRAAPGIVREPSTATNAMQADGELDCRRALGRDVYVLEPPAMEGTSRTRSPSLTQQDSPPRKRMSSSLR
jgi:hypothetical protein